MGVFYSTMTTKVIKDLFERGKYQEVLDRFAQLETQEEVGSFIENEQIEYTVYHSLALKCLGQYKQGLQVATTARTKIQKTDNISLLLALLSVQVRILQGLGQMEDVNTLITEGDSFLKKLPVIEQETGSFGIYLFKFSKGNFLNYTGKPDLALDYLHKALAGFESLDTPGFFAETLHFIGRAYYHKAEHDTALKHYQRSLNSYERLDHKYGIAMLLLNIGHIYIDRGKHDTTMEYYQRSLTVAEESGIPEPITWSLNYIGWAYAQKSKFDIALEYSQRALTLSETTDYMLLISSVMHNRGTIYRLMGDFDNSLTFLQQTLTLMEGTGFDTSNILWDLILQMIDRKELPQAQSYLTNMQELYTRSPTKKIQYLTRLAEALVLKQSPRMAKKAQAQTILKEIVTEDAFSWRWHFAMIGLLHLCELLVFETKATGEVEVWEETKTFIHQFYTKAQHSKDVDFIGEVLLLKAKIAMIEGELPQALTFIDQAKTAATEKNVTPLMDKVEAEQQRLEADLEKWSELSLRNASLQERLQQAKLEQYIEKAQELFKILEIR